VTLLAEENERKLFGRRRRRNAPAGESRQKVYRVYVTAAEDEQLRARAAVEGVTVPRLLFESALNARVETSTERKAAIAELFAIRRLLANVASNANQIARYANADRVFPAEATAMVDVYRLIVPELQAAVRSLADS
jgi:hypothetical protein